jgi:TRAP-type C4-dicarboxylate transport system permease small subunit
MSTTRPTWLSNLDRNLERWALLVFYSMLVVTMAVEVLRRELFSYSSVWGEEVVRYAFIYLVWIGAAAAVRERAHIRIDVIFEFVSPRVKALLYLFGDLVMLGVACFALYWSWESVAVSLKFGSVSHGLRVPMAWFLSAVPIGFLLLLYRLQQSIRRDLSDLRHGRPVFEGERLFD